MLIVNNKYIRRWTYVVMNINSTFKHLIYLNFKKSILRMIFIWSVSISYMYYIKYSFPIYRRALLCSTTQLQKILTIYVISFYGIDYTLITKRERNLPAKLEHR